MDIMKIGITIEDSFYDDYKCELSIVYQEISSLFIGKSYPLFYSYLFNEKMIG